jgi:hypothetical protein
LLIQEERGRWGVSQPIRSPALEADEWSAPRSGRFTTGKNRYPLHRKPFYKHKPKFTYAFFYIIKKIYSDKF